MEEIKNTKRAERRKRTISKFKKRMKDVQVSGFKWMTEKAQTKIIKMMRDTPKFRKWNWEWDDFCNSEKKKNSPYKAVNKKELSNKCMIEVDKDVHEDLTLSAQEANPPFHMFTKWGNKVVFTFDPDRDEYVGKMIDSDEIGIVNRSYELKLLKNKELKLLKNKDWKTLFGRDPFRPYNDMFDAYDYEEYDTEALEKEVNPMDDDEYYYMEVDSSAVDDRI